MASHTQALASAIAGYDPAGLGPAPVAKAKLCLIDFLGCAFEASGLAPSREAVAALPAGAGGWIIGESRTATPPDAAFANAVMGHGLVREDMHAASVCHHGVVVWPLMLALAAEGRVAGDRLLAAAVLAYEVGGRLGRMLVDPAFSALYRPTGVVAPVGAAAGGAWLAGLDRGGVGAAVAIAANTSGGLNQWPASGASDMYFHPGFAARNAWLAVRLAEAGAYGSPDVLEGRAGLFAAFGRRPMPGPVGLFPGGEADILNVYHKAAPACNFAQTACQAALRLVEGMGPEAAPVTAIRIRVPAAAANYPGCDALGPFDRQLQAKMSIPYGVAAVLAHRRLAEANYRDLADPEVARLSALTVLEASPEMTAAFPRVQSASIEVTLADERRLATSLEDVIPATEAEIRDRFRAAAGAVLGAEAADRIEGAVDGLDQSADAGRLAAMLARATPARRRRKVAAAG